jgi:hypothetical protein
MRSTANTARISNVANMRRSGQEPPPGMPEIQHRPGLAKEILRQLAPLLAEEGIDVDNIDAADVDTLQAAMDRAVERLNVARFTPVGEARDYAVTTLRLVIEAIAEDNTELADAILDSVPSEAPDGKSATVAGCIGVALGLLDDWLSGHDRNAPAGLTQQARPPSGKVGERAARDILVLAHKRRAFRSLDALITRQGGRHVLYGSALALTAATRAWSEHTGRPITDLARAEIR